MQNAQANIPAGDTRTLPLNARHIFGKRYIQMPFRPSRKEKSVNHQISEPKQICACNRPLNEFRLVGFGSPAQHVLGLGVHKG